MKHYCLLYLSVLLVACSAHKVQHYCNPNPYTPVVDTLSTIAIGQQPRNVILMIGDGMGLTHVAAAWTLNGGHLNLDACPYVGLSRTYCADTLITDSGAGGTALACGQKTAFRRVGTDVNGQPIPSLIEIAHSLGMTTGVSVVCRLCDATPSDFCCHTPNRKNQEDIIEDYSHTPADYIVGGGAAFFHQPIMDTATLFSASQLPVFALLADSEYVPAPMRGDVFQRQTMHGISLLHNATEQGFFMMVEGSCIDDWSHANDLERTMQETLDFDRTVGEVLRWAAQDGQTLVVITADHETGGLALVSGNLERREIGCNFAHHSHTNILVPVYAFGPGAEHFTGIQENAEIAARIMSLLTQNN